MEAVIGELASDTWGMVQRPELIKAEISAEQIDRRIAKPGSESL